MKYVVQWNSGDDIGEEFFNELKVAQVFAKSVHGAVYKLEKFSYQVKATRLVKMQMREKK